MLEEGCNTMERRLQNARKKVACDGKKVAIDGKKVAKR